MKHVNRDLESDFGEHALLPAEFSHASALLIGWILKS